MIYFIQLGDNGRIRIGYSKDPTKRLKTLQTGVPDALNLLGVLNGDKAREEAIHQRFSDLRAHGEWFEPSVELVDFIRQNTRTLEVMLPRRSTEVTRPTTHRDHIRYLWEDWIPRKECSMLIGGTGVGKSFVALDLLRRLLRNEPMPDGKLADRLRENVILVDVNGHIQELADRMANWQSAGLMSEEHMGRFFVLEELDQLAEAYDLAITVLGLTLTTQLARRCRFVISIKPKSRSLSHLVRSLELLASDVAPHKALDVEFRNSQMGAVCLTYHSRD